MYIYIHMWFTWTAVSVYTCICISHIIYMYVCMVQSYTYMVWCNLVCMVQKLHIYIWFNTGVVKCPVLFFFQSFEQPCLLEMKHTQSIIVGRCAKFRHLPMKYMSRVSHHDSIYIFPHIFPNNTRDFPFCTILWVKHHRITIHMKIWLSYIYMYMYVHYFVTYEPQYFLHHHFRSRLHREVPGARKNSAALQKSMSHFSSAKRL